MFAVGQTADQEQNIGEPKSQSVSMAGAVAGVFVGLGWPAHMEIEPADFIMQPRTSSLHARWMFILIFPILFILSLLHMYLYPASARGREHQYAEVVIWPRWHFLPQGHHIRSS